VGLGAERLEPVGPEQLSLLDSSAEARDRRTRLNSALDAIRARFGPAALERAEGGVERAGLSFQIKRGEDRSEPRAQARPSCARSEPEASEVIRGRGEDPDERAG